jgi:Leucine-rich repeat (LRR) protein
MHSNKLSVLPSSFESLAFLRTLNLSTNALTNDALDSITQISTLVELYLAHNAIEGQLPSTIASLKGLYILDLVGNKITALPESIGEIGRMRILLLGDNQLESLPWDALETLGDLYELDISSNKLKGDLVTSNIDNLTLPSLSNLDVHANSLAALSSSLHLPSLTQFNATQNAITATGTFFTNTPRLVHLSLSQNQLAALPDGIVHLTHLRTLDISNNIIEHIDPRLGLLDELTTFQWMGNLIRSRAWGSMDTEGIKSALRAKADEAVMREISEDLANARLNACRGECHGILDLSGKIKEMPLTEEMLSEHVHLNHFPILSKIILQKNKLSVVPMELSLVTTLTTLDLSRNFLPSKLFDQPVILESLVNLDISVNRLDSLEFLPTIISAPALKILDVSFNSLTSLIPLRVYFPNITILHANSNQLTSITPSDFEGLEIVQVNNNSINRLPPELGLVDSVRILGVDGNTFRVPGRRIVDAGSAAVLEWLRGRCVVQN